MRPLWRHATAFKRIAMICSSVSPFLAEALVPLLFHMAYSQSSTAWGPVRLEKARSLIGLTISPEYQAAQSRPRILALREEWPCRISVTAFCCAMQRSRLRTPFMPENVFRAYQGGLNDTQFSQWLDNNLFHGATFKDLHFANKPHVFINASDVYNRVPFIFDGMTFKAICSDLDSYPIASAVAASAAMPVVFAPTVIASYANRCEPELPAWIVTAQTNQTAPPLLKEYADAIGRYRDGSVPFIKLLDGGLVDNYGLSGLTIERLAAATPYGPLTAQRAVKVRRLLFLVVDAGRGPSGDWAQSADGPTAPEIVQAAADTAIDSSARSSFTAFDQIMAEWHEALIHWRCGLSPSERQSYGITAKWDCRDLKFFVGRINFEQLGPKRAFALQSIPTRFKLTPDEVETSRYSRPGGVTKKSNLPAIC